MHPLPVTAGVGRGQLPCAYRSPLAYKLTTSKYQSTQRTALENIVLRERTLISWAVGATALHTKKQQQQ